MTDFSGKKVFVLGGSRGIGAAIVRRFAGDGASVTFSYAGSHDAAQALAAETGATAIRSDAADRQAVTDVVAAQGPIDILVVNAGVAILGDPLDLDPDAIDRLFDINIRAPYHAAVEAGRRMPDGGRILVIGSNIANAVPFAGATAYATSKAALQGLGRGLARDFAARGITVNIIQPGPTDTDMNPADGPLAQQLDAFMAIKRYATTQEIAGLATFLAGPDAAMITGATHTMDGGFSA
jgi:cyclic-di-GMP-binding biofilm dispersal mediator protein